MPIRVGNKAEGRDFFDRVREREEIWRYLEGNHIVLSGPRRLGKTSLLQRIACRNVNPTRIGVPACWTACC